MKVVINVCFGEFGLSWPAVKRLAELQGRTAYCFEQEEFSGPYIPVDCPDGIFWNAFDVPNPNERANEPNFYHTHHINDSPDNRHDPLLTQVVEELGDAANGSFAKLKVIEIPDGIEYIIDEYDGNESIHEQHRSWS